MRPGEPHDALALDIVLEDGTGLSAIGYLGELEVGAWEMAPGVDEDVELDEVFVVIAGAGTLEFLEPALPTVALHPGVVVRLADGMKTRWTVTETLRKVYLAP
ncbi:cupin domain-containing protein [Demequina soli]|uniref:cupin domain-containing protein n=1 Tax=Demequina soli TaxID=1638987 RepID=UPI0007817B60|nr:cupin domain-containing protein [Demequina soli]